MKTMDHYVIPADKGFPLTAGFELYHSAPDEAPVPGLPFRFTVALSEPGIAEGRELLTTIKDLVAEVQHVARTLVPRIS